MTRTKHCKKCNRVIAEKNKSGFCCGCAANEKHKEKRRKMCFICEEPCNGKLLVEWRKGQIISLCTYHFNKVLGIKDPKALRKEIRKLKSYH